MSESTGAIFSLRGAGTRGGALFSLTAFAAVFTAAGALFPLASASPGAPFPFFPAGFPSF
ncbi:MAG: hypothetical protein ABI193_02615 [Minicystis sp.]